MGKIEIRKKDLKTAFKILEELRVSLDRIGAIGSHQGMDAMNKALNEYFTSGVYKRIVAGVSALAKYLSFHENDGLSRATESHQYYFRKTRGKNVK